MNHINVLTKKENDQIVGDVKVDAYADAYGMDDRNREGLRVLVNGTKEEFIKHVFTGDQGETLSYAEMRARYG